MRARGERELGGRGSTEKGRLDFSADTELEIRQINEIIVVLKLKLVIFVELCKMLLKLLFPRRRRLLL